MSNSPIKTYAPTSFGVIVGTLIFDLYILCGLPLCWGKQEGAQWETKGDKTLGKADTPSNKDQQEGVQWETKGDKTLGKADTPSNKRKHEGVQ